MKQSSYKHYDLSQAKRNTLTVNRFGGVDLSTPKLLVDSSRAIDASNFIYRNNTVQKRHGFEEVFKVSPIQYYAKGDTVNLKTNPVNFNGLWYFKAEDGNNHFIAHIGKLLCKITNFGSPTATIEPLKIRETNGHPECYEFENYKSSAFVGNKRLWFLGGNRYMVLRFKANGTIIFEPVDESEDTYIPTTTISITANGTGVGRRQSLDNTNLMTKWRVNKCITGLLKSADDTTSNFVFELDAPIVFQDTTSATELGKMSGKLIERGKYNDHRSNGGGS